MRKEYFSDRSPETKKQENEEKHLKKFKDMQKENLENGVQRERMATENVQEKVKKRRNEIITVLREKKKMHQEIENSLANKWRTTMKQMREIKSAKKAQVKNQRDRSICLKQKNIKNEARKLVKQLEWNSLAVSDIVKPENADELTEMAEIIHKDEALENPTNIMDSLHSDSSLETVFHRPTGVDKDAEALLERKKRMWNQRIEGILISPSKNDSSKTDPIVRRETKVVEQDLFKDTEPNNSESFPFDDSFLTRMIESSFSEQIIVSQFDVLVASETLIDVKEKLESSLIGMKMRSTQNVFSLDEAKELLILKEEETFLDVIDDNFLFLTSKCSLFQNAFTTLWNNQSDIFFGCKILFHSFLISLTVDLKRPIQEKKIIFIPDTTITEIELWKFAGILFVELSSDELVKLFTESALIDDESPLIVVFNCNVLSQDAKHLMKEKCSRSVFECDNLECLEEFFEPGFETQIFDLMGAVKIITAGDTVPCSASENKLNVFEGFPKIETLLLMMHKTKFASLENERNQLSNSLLNGLIKEKKQLTRKIHLAGKKAVLAPKSGLKKLNKLLGENDVFKVEVQKRLSRFTRDHSIALIQRGIEVENILKQWKADLEKHALALEELDATSTKQKHQLLKGCLDQLSRVETTDLHTLLLSPVGEANNEPNDVKNVKPLLKHALKLKESFQKSMINRCPTDIILNFIDQLQIVLNKEISGAFSAIKENVKAIGDQLDQKEPKK